MPETNEEKDEVPTEDTNGLNRPTKLPTNQNDVPTSEESFADTALSAAKRPDEALQQLIDTDPTLAYQFVFNAETELIANLSPNPAEKIKAIEERIKMFQRLELEVKTRHEASVAALHHLVADLREDERKRLGIESPTYKPKPVTKQVKGTKVEKAIKDIMKAAHCDEETARAMVRGAVTQTVKEKMVDGKVACKHCGRMIENPDYCAFCGLMQDE